ncbi:MAG: DEAD/DEAH box helicase [Kiritimatiellae bacterium]|jgi:ATP-dependent RNA helicase RhlE|nr:DEAD/DEAH box helicase [Kiritimatiellia bacterium]
MTHSQINFRGLGIEPGLLNALDEHKFITPTPIQYKAIPIAIEGKDLIGIAQTGTGKTLAFGIPMVQRLGQKPGQRGLVLVPTRELAMQVNDALVKITPVYKLKTTVVIGGASMHEQLLRLKQNPQIIIATPGRLNDHIEHHRLRLDDVGVLVLDEADRMLDMGFLPQIERILKTIPRARQTMLFSATIPPSIVKIASRHMQMPVQTEIAPSGTAAELVSQELFVTRRELKGNLLNELLKQYSGSVLLFVRTKRSAARVARLLENKGHSVAEIHADRSLGQRKDALRGFKSGQYRILVATDIAARGIDVAGIELVINYDLPDDPENYVHRIGRTGRAGKTGHAITLAMPDQKQDVLRIEKIIRASIPLSTHPDMPAEKFYPPPKVMTRSFRPSRRRWRR